MDVTERGKLMTRLADLIEENKELLATIDAWDNGMLLRTHSRSLLIIIRQELFRSVEH